MVTYLGSLVQSCSGEGGTLQTNITGMCGECSQYLSHTGFAPTHGMCAFQVYTAQAPGCSAGELSKVGPGLRARPRSKLLRFRFSGSPQTWLGLHFVPFLGPSSSRTRCLESALSPGSGCVLLPPLSQPLCFLDTQQVRRLRDTVCLFWGADLWLRPSRWMPAVQNPRKSCLAPGSLLAVW